MRGKGWQGHNIFRFWRVETSLGVFVPLTREGKFIVPVLEFDKIGKDGDFTKPYTYTLEYMDYRYDPNLAMVSRNDVPESIKDYFREFCRSGEEKREGVKQEEVGVS